MVQVLQVQAPVLQKPEADIAEHRHGPPLALGRLGGGGGEGGWGPPVSQQEVVWFDVGVDDAGGVQLLHHGQDAAAEVHDERLRHHLLAQAFVDVHCILVGGEATR